MKSLLSRQLATALCALSSVALMPSSAWAGTGKLVLTGGVSSVEGAAGGGITPWAFIGTQAAQSESGFSAYTTRAVTQDYGLNSSGIAWAHNNRVELSLAQQRLNASDAGAPLGLPSLALEQTIVGGKVRLMGNGVLDTDDWRPQVAIGVLHKSLSNSGLDGTLNALGAKKSGTDFYVSATKLYLAQGILVNTTLRATNANQNGLLGFGAKLGGDESSYSLHPEVSVAKLLGRNIAVGAEYRSMPNNLVNAGRAAGLGDGLRADDWMDIFVAWAPTKNLSLTTAYVDLGRIVPGTTGARSQTGLYVSAQLSF